MTTIRAILSETNSADKAVKKLSELKIEDLEWRIFQPQDEHDRLVPLAPAGTYPAVGGSASTPVGVPVVADLPEDEVLEEAGVPDEEADYYAESLAHGATVIVIDSPAKHKATVQKVLEASGASRITAE
jgi:hypothetical protein